MAGTETDRPLKRKRVATKVDKDVESSPESNQGSIADLEAAILESKKNYNKISDLLALAQRRDGDEDVTSEASVALCRVFVRLLTSGALTLRKDLTQKEQVVGQWLRQRLTSYKQLLLSLFSDAKSGPSSLRLAMTVLKAEGRYLNSNSTGYTFPKSSLDAVLREILIHEHESPVRVEFYSSFLNDFDDIRFYTFKLMRDIISQSVKEQLEDDAFKSYFGLLTAVDDVEPDSQIESFYFTAPEKKSHPVRSLLQHKNAAQDAWLVLIERSRTKKQRNEILLSMETDIAPWFARPAALADFLTDCYDVGVPLSLLALSGLFYLIRECNLDYPDFYAKLYSLLTPATLHSPQRSHFLRLLDTFLSSSHLPSVLVASFIKRLARLSLFAPPAASVAILPFVYNLFQKHPLCTFMLHRVPRTQEERNLLETDGLADPFVETEADPMLTRAIDSCVWELAQLQSHYNPTVASIAKIISEQFTKQSYNMEAFLDHSYESMLQTEIAKVIVRPPPIEPTIPQRVFLKQDPSSGKPDSLLVKLWDFS